MACFCTFTVYVLDPDPDSYLPSPHTDPDPTFITVYKSGSTNPNLHHWSFAISVGEKCIIYGKI